MRLAQQEDFLTQGHLDLCPVGNFLGIPVPLGLLGLLGIFGHLGLLGIFGHLGLLDIWDFWGFFGPFWDIFTLDYSGGDEVMGN